jgi:hypothetical protein
MAAVACLLSLAPAALAGGSFVTWEKGAYAPGETVRGTTTFGKGCCNRGVPQDGPFYVYLYHSVEGSEIPPLPPDAVLVGAIEIEGNASPWTATYELVVPLNTPPGEYDVVHCNDPCTKMLGDLVEPQLVVANDPEVRQWGRLRWLERRVFGTSDRQRRAIEHVGRDLTDTRAELLDRIGVLESRVDDLQVQLAAPAGTTEGQPLTGGLVAGSTVLLLLAAHLLSKRN